MPLKNYTTVVPAEKSIAEIHTALIKHGAIGIAYEYEKDGKVKALAFRLVVGDQPVSFALPAEWRRFQAVLIRQRVRTARNEPYVYRVAWRCVRDWVLAQLALHETNMVDLPQVFLPFAYGHDGRTLYDVVASNPGSLLLKEAPRGDLES